MPPPSRQQFKSYVEENYTWKATDCALYCPCQMWRKPTSDIRIRDIIWSGVTTVGLTYRAFIQT